MLSIFYGVVFVESTKVRFETWRISREAGSTDPLTTKRATYSTTPLTSNIKEPWSSSVLIVLEQATYLWLHTHFFHDVCYSWITRLWREWENGKRMYVWLSQNTNQFWSWKLVMVLMLATCIWQELWQNLSHTILPKPATKLLQHTCSQELH